MQNSRRSFLKGAALSVSAAVLPLPTLTPEATAQDLSGVVQAAHPPSPRLADLVNVLQGTNSTPSFSRGNTLPIVAAPFGMAHWALQTTSERGPWYFHPQDPRIEGVRCTHQLSPWLGDYGHLTLLPFTGTPALGAGRRASSYRPSELKLTPYSLSVRLMRYNVSIDMVPTERGALFSFRFPESGPAGICLSIPGTKGSARSLEKPGLFLFTSPKNEGGVARDFATYYVAQVDVPDTRLRFTQEGEEGLAALRFTVRADQRVTLRVGCSFISEEQAYLNLQREIGQTSLAALQNKSAALWEQQLGRVTLAEPDDTRRRIFYSCLYRASLFPRIWHEFNDANQMVHRSPYNGRVEPGPMYADHGFWDVYRAWYPMMTVLYPERLGEILQSWVNAYKEGGWLPQFPCPGYRGAMSGSPIDSVLADAAVKNISGFDLHTAFEGLVKEANTPVAHPFGFGRQGVADYLELGYLPLDNHGGALTESLDAAYGDFCIGQIAQVLGMQAEAATFSKRAANWHKVFDPSTKFLRPRMRDGSFPPGFVPNRWGGGYVEGSAWQYRVSVPHDAQGLIAAMGGNTAFAAVLHELVTTPPLFDVGDYGFEIHEMAEMAAVDFGQYAHSNQPSHHILYMFPEAGRADRMQYWVRRVLTELYTTQDFCGDEDTGAMAAWYVLSSLGFYALCPGKPEYTLGSPLFPEATVHLQSGNNLRITAAGQAMDRPFVKSTALGGRKLSGWKISHAELTSGAELAFRMGSA